MQVTYYSSVCAVLTALLAVWVTGRRARTDGWAVLWWAATVAGATVAFAVLGTVVVGMFRFGYLNLAFRQLVVGLPLAAALIGVRSWRRGWRGHTSGFASVVLAGTLLLAPLGAYMAVVEPNRLVVREAALAVPGIPDGHSVRVGVITDLQTTGPGRHEQDAVTALMAAHPDVILFPGDVFQGTPARFILALPALRALLGQLHALGGVLIVGGDVDTDERLAALTIGTDLRYLRNEITTTTVNGTRVVIGGIGLDYTSPSARAVAEALESRPGRDEVRILLAHRPDAVELLPASGPATDVVVAGHTHGGQVVLPFYGPPHTLTGVPRDVAAGGLHHMGDRAIYVGTGVGVERNQAPRMRLLDPPSVAILTLTSR